MLWRKVRRCAVVPAVSVLAAAGVYALFSLYFFDLELRATLVARRADQLQSLVSPARRPCCTESSERNATSALTKEHVSGVVEHVGGLVNKNISISGKETLPTDDARVNNYTRKGCEWVNFTAVKDPPYFLTVVLILRVYGKDLSELTSLDVKHWLLYLCYAGVEHVYLYDLWFLPGESQREPLDTFVREGYLTYFDRHELNPFDIAKSQHASYQHCIDNFGKDTTWQAAIDIDEYPFCPEDTEPGFLSRYVKKYSEENRDVSEITMGNFLYLGVKNKSREFLFDKLWRHTHGPANPLVKPIYKTANIWRAQVHHNLLHKGVSRMAPSSQLRMNHYWGARLQNWGPDTEESLAKTEEDRGMQQIVAAFKKCKSYINEYL